MPRRVTEEERLFGERVRRARRMAGMSQADLSEHLGVSYQQIQKYETGASRISASTLVRIADITYTPIQEFFMRPGFEDSGKLNNPVVSSLVAASDELLNHFEGTDISRLKEHLVAVVQIYTALTTLVDLSQSPNDSTR